MLSKCHKQIVEHGRSCIGRIDNLILVKHAAFDFMNDELLCVIEFTHGDGTIICNVADRIHTSVSVRPFQDNALLDLIVVLVPDSTVNALSGACQRITTELKGIEMYVPTTVITEMWV